jgi:hypothetical protein
LKRDAEWADAASSGTDVEKIISYWTDDALVVPPGQPVVEGKAAIRAFVADSLKIPGFKIHWVHAGHEPDDGSWARWEVDDPAHQDTAREIWKRHATTHLEPAVASAVAAGLLRKEELPAQLVQHIAGLIEFYEHDLSAS